MRNEIHRAARADADADAEAAAPRAAALPPALAAAIAAAPTAAPDAALAAALAVALLFGASCAAAATATAVPVDTLPRFAAPHFNFVVVGVADAARALAFYTGALGLRERGRAQPDLQYFEIIVGVDDQPLTPGISLKYRNGPPQPRGNGSSALNLVVTDLAAIVQRVERLGGKVTLPYQRRDTAALSYGFAVIEDPDGNAIELVEYHRLPGAAK